MGKSDGTEALMKGSGRAHRRRSGIAATLTAGLVCVAGCSSGGSAPIVSGQHHYGATYLFQQIHPGEDVNVDRMELLTDGGAKVRLTFSLGPRIDSIILSDGSRAVSFHPGNSSHTTEKVADVPPFVLHPDDGTLARWCLKPNSEGQEQVLARTAKHYTCKDPGIQLLFQAKELWVDSKTGLVLRWEKSDLLVTASKIDFAAFATSAAFQPPAGAKEHLPGP